MANGEVYDVRVIVRGNCLQVEYDGRILVMVDRGMVDKINDATLGAIARAWLVFFGWRRPDPF